MSSSSKTAKARAVQGVLDTAMQWHFHLMKNGVGADYHAYWRAFERLKRACDRLKKVSP